MKAKTAKKAAGDSKSNPFPPKPGMKKPPPKAKAGAKKK